MKALYLDGGGKVHLENVPVPSPGAGEVLVRVLHSGVCQTEIRYYLGEGAPRILGHEFVGRVEEAGPGVEAFARGDAVMCYPSLPCGRCAVCRSGHATVCPHNTGLRGGFAEYIAADARFFLKVPEDFANRHGVLLYDVFGMMYRGMEPLGIGPDSCTAIVGLQPYGLGGVAIARQMGARVVAFDASDYRRRIARELGADLTLDGRAENLRAAVMEATGGEFFTEVVECDDPAIPFKDLFDWVRNGGRLCLMGHTKKPISISPDWVTTRKITVSGAPRPLGEQLPEILEIARKCDKKDAIITHEPRLEDAAAALADYANGKAGKIAFDLT